MVQPRAGTVIFQPQHQLAREKKPEPTKGMVVVRGQEGMLMRDVRVDKGFLEEQAYMSEFGAFDNPH